MRVLVVLSQPPAPEGGAAARCAVGLLRGLRAHGMTVTALAANVGPQSIVPPPPDLGVEVMAVEEDPAWQMRAARYVKPVSLLGRGPFAARVRELAARADVVQLEEVTTAAAGEGLETPSVAHLHCLARIDRPLGVPWERSTREALEFIRADRRVIRHAPRLLASTAEIGRALERQGARDVSVARLALDPGQYEIGDPARPPVAGVIGTAAWPPTANAVRRLLTSVWPEVLRRRPDAVLRLAGRGMDPERFEGLPDLPGVEWLGEVASAEAFLRSIGVLAYPLGRGTGMKIKVLEAMALAVPVVTTPPGAEGLAAGAGVIVETEDVSIAAAIDRLLGDPAERAARGRAGREQFERDHAPAPATAPLVGLYERMAG